jgi:endonuclease YncB( thermonuclease family)
MIRTMEGATIAALAVAGLATTAAARRYQPPSTPLPIAATTGVPTSIHDGDTFRFGKLRVRVWGIDAPELETQFGPAARAQLVQLVADRRVTCRDTGKRNHDRIVAQCWNWQGTDLAAAMARTGWAVNWSTFSHGRYLADQQAAQRERRGVFAYGVQPWR